MNAIYNIYDAKTNFSKLIARVEAGETITIARNGKPLVDVAPHVVAKPKRTPGLLAGKLHYKDEDLEGIDPEIMEMFFGKDWESM